MCVGLCGVWVCCLVWVCLCMCVCVCVWCVCLCVSKHCVSAVCCCVLRQTVYRAVVYNEKQIIPDSISGGALLGFLLHQLGPCTPSAPSVIPPLRPPSLATSLPPCGPFVRPSVRPSSLPRCSPVSSPPVTQGDLMHNHASLFCSTTGQPDMADVAALDKAIVLLAGCIRSHSFPDGNGRTCRALYALTLLSAGGEVQLPSPEFDNAIVDPDNAAAKASTPLYRAAGKDCKEPPSA